MFLKREDKGAIKQIQGCSSEKPGITMILPRNLYPLVSGYSLKNYNLIKILSKEYAITLFVISRDEITADERNFYGRYTAETQIYYISTAERIQGVLFALMHGLPIQVGLYFSHRLSKLIGEELKNGYEFCICELIRTMQYAVERAGRTKIIFDMVDSIGLNYQRSSKETKSFLFKTYYTFETKRLLKYEKKCIEKANTTFLFNREEQKCFEGYGKVVCLPHGVKEELLCYQPCEDVTEIADPYVAFIGKMDYRPNIDAMLWYVEHIHTKLSARPGLVITGAYPTAQIMKLQKRYPDIIVTGFVEDPYRFLAGAIAVIAPMQTGGGIQNKVLEAMALGKLCLLSTKAAKPITGAEDGKDFLICDTLSEYENCYNRMFQDSNYGTTIGENARKFILARYTWEQYGTQYLERLKEA